MLIEYFPALLLFIGAGISVMSGLNLFSTTFSWLTAIGMFISFVIAIFYLICCIQMALEIHKKR